MAYFKPLKIWTCLVFGSPLYKKLKNKLVSYKSDPNNGHPNYRNIDNELLLVWSKQWIFSPSSGSQCKRKYWKWSKLRTFSLIRRLFTIFSISLIRTIQGILDLNIKQVCYADPNYRGWKIFGRDFLRLILLT